VPLAGGASQHWHGLTAFGPLARCAADAAAALSVLSGQPGLDLSAAAEPPGRPLRIAVSARHPSLGARVAPAVRASLEQAADLLRAAGHTVTRARPPYPASLGLRFSSRWLAGIAEDARDLRADALEARTQAMVRRGRRAAKRVRPASDDPFAARAADWLGHYDALLTPTLARPAVPLGTWAGQGWVRAMLGVGNWLYTTPWNLAGLPAASVPFGSDQGLPLGLQIVAPAGGEPTVLALAAQLEQLRP
jgi:amidase